MKSEKRKPHAHMLARQKRDGGRKPKHYCCQGTNLSKTGPMEIINRNADYNLHLKMEKQKTLNLYKQNMAEFYNT